MGSSDDDGGGRTKRQRKAHAPSAEGCRDRDLRQGGPTNPICLSSSEDATDHNADSAEDATTPSGRSSSDGGNNTGSHCGGSPTTGGHNLRLPLWADMHSDDEDEGEADEDTTAAAEGDLRMPLWADIHSDDGDSWADLTSDSGHSDAGSLSEPQEEPAAGASGGTSADAPRNTGPDEQAKP